MKSKKVIINKLEYTISATTDLGLENAIKSLKKSLKKNKEQDGI